VISNSRRPDIDLVTGEVDCIGTLCRNTIIIGARIWRRQSKTKSNVKVMYADSM